MSRLNFHTTANLCKCTICIFLTTRGLYIYYSLLAGPAKSWVRKVARYKQKGLYWRNAVIDQTINDKQWASIEAIFRRK
jgi:hypothetical protein